MRTTLKKFLVFMLSLVMVITAVPMTAFAYDVQTEPYNYYRMDGDWYSGFDGSEMGITVENASESDDFECVSTSAFSNHYYDRYEYNGDRNIRLSNYSTEGMYITPDFDGSYTTSEAITLSLEGDNYLYHSDTFGIYDPVDYYGTLEVIGDLTIKGSGTLHCNTISVSGILTFESGIVEANYIAADNVVVNGGIVSAMFCYVEQQYTQNGGYVDLYSSVIDGYFWSDYAALSARCVEMNGGYLSVDNEVDNCYYSTDISGIDLRTTGTLDHGAKPEIATITGDAEPTDHTSGYAFWMLGGIVDVKTTVKGSSSTAISLRANAINVEAGINKNYRIGLFGGILNAAAYAEVEEGSDSDSTRYAYPINGIVVDGIDGWKDPIDPLSFNSPDLMSFVTDISDAAPDVKDFASNSYDFTDSSSDYTTGSGVGLSKMSQTFAEQFYPNQHDVALKTFHTGDTIRGTYLGAELANDYVLQDVWVTSSDAVNATITSVAGTVFVNGDYYVSSGNAIKPATPSKWYSVSSSAAYYDGKPVVIVNGNVMLEDSVEDVDLIVFGHLVLSGGAIVGGNVIAADGVSVVGNAVVTQGALLTAYNRLGGG